MLGNNAELYHLCDNKIQGDYDGAALLLDKVRVEEGWGWGG